MNSITTIGYEAATMTGFLAALQEAHVELLVDVRAIASSRRPGFSKSKLAANLEGAGIDYRHLRGLGTPAEGRAAAHSGRYEEMHTIYRAHLATPDAQDELETLAELVGSGKRICLLCFEADPTHCHRSLVIDALQEQMPLEVTHLHPKLNGETAPEVG
jgi:uncharacterized protein (DUF488 family)